MSVESRLSRILGRGRDIRGSRQHAQSEVSDAARQPCGRMKSDLRFWGPWSMGPPKNWDKLRYVVD
jgi:hypothetical protein